MNYYIVSENVLEPFEKIVADENGEKVALKDLSCYDDKEKVFIIRQASVDYWGEMWELKKELNLEYSNEHYAENNYIKDLKTQGRKSIFCQLDTAYSKEYDFIEVTEWSNGEGYDITISDRPIISLHETEFEVIRTLIRKLNN